MTDSHGFIAGDRVYFDLDFFGINMPGTVKDDGTGNLFVELDEPTQDHPGEGPEIWTIDPSYTRLLPASL